MLDNKTKINMTCVSSHRCLGSLVVRKKEFCLKGFISLEKINLSRGKTKLQILFVFINHGIFRQTCYIIQLSTYVEWTWSVIEQLTSY